MEVDLSDTTDRLLDADKINAKQQRELDALADLHRKVQYTISNILLLQKTSFLAQ